MNGTPSGNDESMRDHGPIANGQSTDLGPIQWYQDALKRYVDFSGRTRRSGYWWFFLIHTIAWIALGFAAPAVAAIYAVGTLLPGLGVSVRRLHDTGRSGWWWLINIIPLVGFVVFTVFLASDGTRGANRYGPDPKAGDLDPVTGDYCTTCGTDCPPDVAFCGQCGARRA